MITGIRRDAPPHPVVVWDDWQGREPIRNGRILKHLPSGCVFAVETLSPDDPFDLTARLIDGPEVAGVEDIGREAIGYFTIAGQFG